MTEKEYYTHIPYPSGCDNLIPLLLNRRYFVAELFAFQFIVDLMRPVGEMWVKQFHST